MGHGFRPCLVELNRIVIRSMTPSAHRAVVHAFLFIPIPKIRQVSAESIAEKQRRISGEDAAAESGQVRALEEELQRLQNELTDKEEVRPRH